MNMLELKTLIRGLDRESLKEMQGVGDDTFALTPAEILIVSTVARDGPLTVGAIAKSTGFVQSYVSNVVARLQGSGVLQVGNDPDDLRRTVVSLHADTQDRIAYSLDIDARPLIERIVGDDGTYEVDDILGVLQYLANRLEIAQETAHTLRRDAPR